MIEKLLDTLKRDEGTHIENGRHTVYQDHLGFSTIGYGRLVDGRRGGGLSDTEAQYLLERDVSRIITEVARRASAAWGGLAEARRAVLVMMAYQMGVNGMLDFKKMLAALESHNYTEASRQMQLSLWAQQTPERANRLCRQMKEGVWV